MNITLTVAEMFAAACERMESEAQKPARLIDCPVCGRKGEVESSRQPGRCWLFCEEDS